MCLHKLSNSPVTCSQMKKLKWIHCGVIIKYIWDYRLCVRLYFEWIPFLCMTHWHCSTQCLLWHYPEHWLRICFMLNWTKERLSGVRLNVTSFRFFSGKQNFLIPSRKIQSTGFHRQPKKSEKVLFFYISEQAVHTLTIKKWLIL